MAWLKEHNQCAKTQAQEVCTRDRYLQRLAWLRTASQAAQSADDRGISIGPVAYRCDKTAGLLNVTFVNADPALAYIRRLKKRCTLAIQPSGSGAKYMGVGGETFWEHHGEALYQEGHHAPEVTCKQEPIG